MQNSTETVPGESIRRGLNAAAKGLPNMATFDKSFYDNALYKSTYYLLTYYISEMLQDTTYGTITD